MADGYWTSLVKAASGRASVAPTTTIGDGGTEAYGGYIVSSEKSPSLQGRQRYVTYSQMLANTSIIAAGTRYFLNILGKSSWSVEPASDSEGKELPGAKEIADFVESCMTDMTTPWSKVVRRAAMYRFFGFGVQEWTAKRREEDGKLGMMDVEPRPQVTIERWDLDDSGTVMGAWQRLKTAGPEAYLPRQKIIHLVDDSLNNSPEGLGLFRHLVKIAQRLDAYEQLEQIAYEMDLRGIPISRAPLRQLREDVNSGKLDMPKFTKLLAPLKRFMSGHIRNERSGIMLDSETYTTDDERNAPSPQMKWDLQLLQGASTSQAEVAAAIQRVTREMAIVLGTEHLLLGSDGTGSLALGTMKVQDFYMTVTSCQNDIKEGYNRDWVGVICTLNGIPKELWPKLKNEDVQFKDVAMMASALQSMATAGAVMTPDDPAINEMRDLMGLSRVSQDITDRVMEESSLKTGAELDAMSAKASAALGKTPPGGAKTPPGEPAKGAKK